MPSRALLERARHAARRRAHTASSRAVGSGQDGWLDAFPWRPDWQLRTGTPRRRSSSAGQMHVPVRGVGQARYLEAAALPPRPARERTFGAARPRRGATTPCGRACAIGGRPLNEAYYVPESRDPAGGADPCGRTPTLVRAAREARRASGRRAGLASGGDARGDRRELVGAAAPGRGLPALTRGARPSNRSRPARCARSTCA